LKNRVLLELQKHGIGGGNTAQPASGTATVAGGLAGQGAASGVVVANSGSAGVHPATETGPDLSSTNLGIAAAIGAALVALLAGLGIRRRKRAAAAAAAANAAVAARAASVATPVVPEEGDDAGVEVHTGAPSAVDGVTEGEVVQGLATGAAVEARAGSLDALAWGEATTHEASAQEAEARDAAAHDGDTREASAHEQTLHDANTHETAAREAASYGATGYAASHETAGDEAAHDEAAHDEAARGEALHDEATHEQDVHDEAANSYAAHDAATHEPVTNEATGEETSAHVVTSTSEASQPATAYDPEAFPVNRPIDESPAESGFAPAAPAAPAAAFDHEHAEQTAEHTSQELTGIREDEALASLPGSSHDVAEPHVGNATPEPSSAMDAPSHDEHQTQEEGTQLPSEKAASDDEALISHETSQQPQTHQASGEAEQDVDTRREHASIEPEAAPAQSAAPSEEEDTLSAEALHASESHSSWGTPAPFPLPEPLEPFPAELAPPKGFPRDAVDAFGSLEFGLPPRLDAAAPVATDSFGAHPVAEPEPAAKQAVSPLPTAPAHVADEIAAGTAGAAAVAGLGAARFGALNLDFDLELPPSPAQPLPLFTPEDLGRIARNKLDLASEYIELGDLAGARALIHEVIEANDGPTRTEARALLSTLAPLS
jgi:pilus assembly protein FimV